MIVVMKPLASDASVKQVIQTIEGKGLYAHLSAGKEVTIIGVVGDKTKLDKDCIQAMPDVEKIVNITESYKLANIKFHPEPTTLTLPHTSIGPENLTVMAGPCAVENEEQILAAARGVKKAGATMLRGGGSNPVPVRILSRDLAKMD